jgi:hypothetical protein
MYTLFLLYIKGVRQAIELPREEELKISIENDLKIKSPLARHLDFRDF